MRFSFGIPLCVWLVVATIGYRAESSVKPLDVRDMMFIRGGQSPSCLTDGKGNCPTGPGHSTYPCTSMLCGNLSGGGYGCPTYNSAGQFISAVTYPQAKPAATGSNGSDGSVFQCTQNTPCHGDCKIPEGSTTGAQACSTVKGAVATPSDPVQQTTPKANDPCPGVAPPIVVSS